MCEKDKQLLDQLTIDPSRISDVIEEHGSQLLGRYYAYANHRAHGNVDVEDVFQEALLKLFDPRERAAIVRAGGCILPYLTRWGYWRLDTLRRQRVDPLDEAALDQHATKVGPGGGPPDQGADDDEAEGADDDGVTSEALAALDRAWWQLSPRDQQLLTMRYFESYSEAEIAEVFGSTEGAIKKALHDARRRLRDLMETEGFEVEG